MHLLRALISSVKIEEVNVHTQGKARDKDITQYGSTVYIGIAMGGPAL